MFFHSFNIGYVDIPNLTTLNVYTHVLDDTKKQVADKMNEILTIS